MCILWLQTNGYLNLQTKLMDTYLSISLSLFILLLLHYDYHVDIVWNETTSGLAQVMDNKWIGPNWRLDMLIMLRDDKEEGTDLFIL